MQDQLRKTPSIRVVADAPTEPKAFARDRGTWPDKPQPIEVREAMVPLPGLGIELSMAALYDGIPDPA
jgi:hypothetical protein